MLNKMFSAWKRRREARIKPALPWLEEGDDNRAEVSVPDDFRCPISLDLMKDPVIVSTGITYDRESIEKWLDGGNSICPTTKIELANFDLIPNHTLRKTIQSWCVDNRSSGVERIPTPKAPVSIQDVLVINERLREAGKKNDLEKCAVLISRVRNLVKDSERNKKCFIDNGIGVALSSCFVLLANGSDENDSVLGEIVASLASLRPLDDETKRLLGSKASFNCLARFLKGVIGDQGRRNSVTLLKEILPQDPKRSDELLEIDGSLEGLLHLILNPIFPAATKAALHTIFTILASSSRESEIASKFGDLGLVPCVIEMLPGSERSVCEMALAVLDRLCRFEGLRERAYEHALAIPVVVKKMHRVSPMATDLTVSVLWRLCKNEKREKGRALVEALQHSGFEKLLLLLQVGCSAKTKEKTTELLKMLNVYRGAECNDSSGFKHLERSY